MPGRKGFVAVLGLIPIISRYSRVFAFTFLGLSLAVASVNAAGATDFGSIYPASAGTNSSSVTWSSGTNPNSVTVQIVVTLTSNPQGAYSITQYAGTNNVGPGASISPQVVFSNAGQSAGTMTGQLSIQWYYNGSSIGGTIYNLTGYVANAMSLSGTNLNVQTYLNTPASGSARLSNNGALPVSVSAKTITGAGAASFQFVSVSDFSATTIPAGGYQDIQIKYLASSLGTQSARINMGFTYDGLTYAASDGLWLQGQATEKPLAIVNTSPSGGLILSSQQIALAVSNPVGSDTYAIYYTTDGSDPTNSPSVQIYAGPFMLNAGSVTLKFYAKNMADGRAGSVVTSSYTVTPATYNLKVFISGNGTITNINSNGPVFGCNGSICSVTFSASSPFTLTATPSAAFLFKGWSGTGSAGVCAGTADCSFTLNADTTLNGTFVSMPPVKVSGTPASYYQTLSLAYGASVHGSSLTMEAQATTFSEDFNLQNGVNLLFLGGYDATYTNNSGYSILHGILIIGSGYLTIEQLVIQ
jgi:hypothetical protein